MQNNEFIEVGENVRLHIRDWGEGKAVVFIPGWPLSHEMFEYQFTQLPKHGLRCIGITQRGFGKSSKPWGAYTYDVFADDLKAVLEKLDLRDVTLVGHSMGGAVALHYMTRHLGGRVSKLVLVGAAAPSFTSRPGFPHGLAPSDVDGLIETCHEDRAKLNSNFGNIFFATKKAVSAEMGAWFFNMGMEASAHAVAECLVSLRDTDLRGELKAVKVPAAIFHGKLDKICPYAFAKSMASGIAGSKIIDFTKSGHGLFYEEKDKFNKELMRFID